MVSGGNGLRQTVPAAGSETGRRHISPQAEEQIADLRKQGVTPTDDEIVWINDICRRLEQPITPSPIATGLPVRLCDGVWFWPFTMQASSWYSWALKNGFGSGGGQYSKIALAFAFACGREPGRFATLYDKVTARKVLGEWRDKLPVTDDELLECIHAMINADVDLPENPRTANRPDWMKEREEAEIDSDKYIAEIVATCGGTPEYWGSQVSMRYLLRQKRAAVRQILAGAGSKDTLTEIAEVQRDLVQALASIEYRALVAVGKVKA